MEAEVEGSVAFEILIDEWVLFWRCPGVSGELLLSWCSNSPHCTASNLASTPPRPGTFHGYHRNFYPRTPDFHFGTRVHLQHSHFLFACKSAAVSVGCRGAIPEEHCHAVQANGWVVTHVDILAQWPSFSPRPANDIVCHRKHMTIPCLPKSSHPS